MQSIKGVPIAKGIAHSPVHILVETKVEIIERLQCSPDEEFKSFHDARLKAIEEVEAIRRKTVTTIGEAEGKIFEAHQSLLEDIELIGQVEDYIKEHQCCAEWALDQVGKSIIAIFESMDNEYMRERAIDIKDIVVRVIKIILGHDTKDHTPESSYILVAHDLTPSQTSSLDTKFVKGIITEVGGKTAHSAIIATLLSIPYIVVEEACAKFVEGQDVVFDGKDGVVVLNPDASTIDFYKNKEIILEAERAKHASVKGKACETLDGCAVELIANIGQAADMAFVKKSEAKSVGLFRTEFIFMDRDMLPTEAEQFDIYKEIVSDLQDGYLTIRTLDIGGDKESPLFDIPKEDNPFLGYRGIRLCLQEEGIFKTQLRAILKASQFGTIKIMFPMIASIVELDQAKAILETCKAELDLEGVSYDKNIAVGMMMETPAAVVMADVFAKEIDFFSIGTNDLIQYTMAVDRSNMKIASLYSQYDPAVLRSIKTIAEAANAENIPVSICGEAAADLKLLPYWISLNITKLSMSVALIPEVKWTLMQLNKKEVEPMVTSLSQARDVKAVLEQLSEFA